MKNEGPRYGKGRQNKKRTGDMLIPSARTVQHAHQSQYGIMGGLKNQEVKPVRHRQRCHSSIDHTHTIIITSHPL